MLYLQMGKLLQINQELQTRLQHYEIAYDQMRMENIIMQDKLHQLGINVLDLVKANCNGMKLVRSPSGSPPQRSTPQILPTEQSSPLLTAGYSMLHPSVLQSHLAAAAERYVKKERETNGGT